MAENPEMNPGTGAPEAGAKPAAEPTVSEKETVQTPETGGEAAPEAGRDAAPEAGREAKPEGGKEAAPEGGPKSLLGEIMGGEEKKGADADDSSVPDTDDAWAAAAVPEGADDGAKAFAASIARDMREASIPPGMYRKGAAIFAKAAQARMDEERAVRAAAEKTAREAAGRAFDKSGWADIRTGMERHVPRDSMLFKVLTQTELGSDLAMLGMLKKLGESARADTPPSSGADGFGGSSLEQRLFARSGLDKLGG